MIQYPACFLQVMNGAQKLKARSKTAENRGKKRENVVGTVAEQSSLRKKKRAGSRVMSVVNITLQVRIVLSINAYFS